MSSLKFIVGDWTSSTDNDPRRACTAAELIILVDDIPVTRLLDQWSKTVTDRARVPLYPMAEWLASNWWRLHEEATTEITDDGGFQPSTDWRLSHDLTAIGGGFIWPRMRFTSEGPFIQISARAVRNAPWEPVRHLSDIQPPRNIRKQDFDNAVDNLIELVLIRLNDSQVSAEPLKTIWADVLAERKDAEVSEWRLWEARMGYDPDEAPEVLMQQIQSFFGRAGKAATAEIAPLFHAENSNVIESIERLIKAPGISARFAFERGSFECPEGEPWTAGQALARAVRDQINQRSGPLKDDSILQLLGITSEDFQVQPESELPIGLGVLSSNATEAVLHFRKRNLPGRRFEAARFLADRVFAPNDDRWLPQTDKSTARQKFQRAFAAEFIAPIAEIGAEFEQNPTSTQIENLADDYMLSPLAIRSHLANHGFLNPEHVDRLFAAN